MSRSFSPLCRIFVPLLIWTMAVLPSPGDSVTLVPTADTSIFEKVPDNNLGSSQTLAAGNTATPAPARALIRFNVAGTVPTGSRITSVVLQLPVVRASTFSEPATFALHRLLVDWGEGAKDANLSTGIGTLASEGEATWEARFHTRQSWVDPGGAAGMDFAASASASGDITGIQTLVFDSNEALVADVQSWLDDPSTNFGWLLKDQFETTGATARRFASCEHPTEKPQLRVDFKAPLRIHKTEIVDGNLCLTFNADARSYVVERREEAETGEWTQIWILPAIDVPADFTVCDPLAEGNRFYRIREL